MEKDHFKDRSYQCKYNEMLQIGDVVLICEKHMQKKINSSDISLLTKGIVVRKLTSKKYHPRGQKLEVYPIRHSINPTDEQIQKVLTYYETHKDLIKSRKNPVLSDKFKVGRAVYLLDKNGNRL